jgi:predicted NAD/FAD-binding protein
MSAVLEKGQVMTANRLRDGVVVFMTRAGGWSEKIDDAALALEPQAAAALEARAKEDERATLVTGSYLFDAERIGSHVRASHIRERLRALGPTVRPDLGKQADGTGGAFAAAEGASNVPV